MHELQTFFPYGVNNGVGDELKTDYMHINVDTIDTHLCPENRVVLILEKTAKVFFFSSHKNV